MEYNPIAINEALAYSFPSQCHRPVEPLLRRAGQHAVPVGHRAAAGRRLRCRSITNPPDVSIARPVAGQLRHGDDRRRPGQPARPVHRPAPAHPVRQLLRPDSAQPGERRADAAVHPVHQLAGDVQLPPVYSVGAPANPPAAGRLPAIPTDYFFVIGSPLGAVTETNPPTVQRDPVREPTTRCLATAPPTSPPSNVVPPGYCQNLMSVPGAAADGPAGYHQVGTTMPGKITPLTPGSGSDAVLLDLPAAAGQSVRAAPARHQSCPTPTTPWSWSTPCGSPTPRAE